MDYNPEFVKELLRVAKLPPERTFTNVEDLLNYLNFEDKKNGAPTQE
jgi:hypothetical protein